MYNNPLFYMYNNPLSCMYNNPLSCMLVSCLPLFSIYRKEFSCIMKALKCKPSAQFAYNYTSNVSSKCGNIISHRSLVFEGRHNVIDLRRSAHRSSIFESRHIDLRRSTHRSSIFEGRHIDLQRLKAETSHRQPNIAPTFRQFVTEYCPPRRSIIIIPKILRCIYVLYI